MHDWKKCNRDIKRNELRMLEAPVTIIVPVYNGERTIRRCIDSLLHQTYKNIELLLIDDGSEDRTAEICRVYAKKYSHIRFIHKENGGEATARNRGLREATGEYVCFVDADDYVEPEFVSILIKPFQNGTAELSVCGFVEELHEKEVFRPHCEKSQFTRAEALAHLLKEQSFRGYVWNKMFRMDVIRRNNLHFCEQLEIWLDVVFVFQYMMVTKQVHYNAVSCYHYQYYHNSISHLEKKECSIPRSFDAVRAKQYMEKKLPLAYRDARTELHIRMVKSALAVIRNIGYTTGDTHSVYYRKCAKMIQKYRAEVLFDLTLKEMLLSWLALCKPRLLMKLYQIRKEVHT